MKFDMTLRKRLVVLVIAAISPLFGIAVIGALMTSQDARERFSQSLELSASLVAADQERVAESARHLLVAVADMHRSMDGNSANCRQSFKNLLDKLPIYTNLGIINADGYVMCDGVSEGPLRFFGDRDYFQEAVKTRKFVVSNYLNGRISKLPILIFALPILNADGSVSAVAFAALKLTELSKTVSSVALPPGSSMIVADRRGTVLASNPQNAAVGQPFQSPALRTAFAAREFGVRQGPDATGKDQLYALLASSGAGDANFLVAVSVGMDDVTGPANRRLLLVFLVLTLVASLGSWLAWLLGGRTIVRPVATILEVTSLLQRGKLDVRVPVLPGGPDNELNLIGQGLNRMAEALERRDRELATELDNTRRTRQKLVDAQRLGRIGQWEYDDQTGKVSWSDETMELFGRGNGSFDGRFETFMEMMHCDDRDRYRQARLAALKAGIALEIEYRILTPSGEVRWMHQLGKHNDSVDGSSFLRRGVVQDITRRKFAELDRERSHELLNRIGELAQVGGWESYKSDKGLDVFWSDQLFKIHGLETSSPKLTADEAMLFYPPESQPLIREALRAAVREGRGWDFEVPFVTATGRRIWVRSQCRAVMKDGKLVGLVGALQDITAQHASQDHLRLLETCVARVNDVVLITELTPEARIVYVNDAFERRTGYSRDEALRNTPRMLQGPNTSASEIRRISEHIRAGKPVQAELLNYTKSGAEYWVELDIVPVNDSAGNRQYYVAVQRDITSRKHSERALMDSDQRYAALFTTAPVPMWVFDAETLQFLTVNEAAVDGYGYTQEEFMSMTILDIRSPEDAKALLELRALNPEVKRPRWQHRRKGGSLFLCEVMSRPVQYGGRAGQFVIAQDVTSQARMEAEVQEHLHTLQRAADAAQAITWHQALNGTMNEIVEQARGVIGAHQAVASLYMGDMQNKAIHVASLSDKYAQYRALFDPNDRSGLCSMVAENNRAIRLTQEELVALPDWCGIDGHAEKHLPMRGWLAVPLMGRSGKSIGVLQLSDRYEGDFSQQDQYVAIEMAQLASSAIENAQLIEQVNQLNTGLELKVAERTAALTRQEALFRALAEQAPQVVWTTDTKGRLTFLNQAWFDVVGGKREDWLGTRWFEAIHPEDLPDVQASWQTAVANRTPYVGIRRLLAKDGSYHTMSYRASPVYGEGDEIVFWVGIDADISEIKAIESALRMSNQELEAFSYSVSHDLRSPLNTVDGFSRLLAKHLASTLDDKSKHYLSRVQAGVAQMGQLIEDLLSLAQVSRAQLRMEPVDISAVAELIVAERRVSSPDRLVNVHVEGNLQASGDVRLIRVVLENLIGNAWKFTGATEQAQIAIGQTEDAAGLPVFFVRDNGAGFDMAYADKLFTAFQRLHTVSEFPGTGIGLATASRVVARHGGKLWAEAAPGKGAAFFFTFPRMPTATDQMSA